MILASAILILGALAVIAALLVRIADRLDTPIARTSARRGWEKKG